MIVLERTARRDKLASIESQRESDSRRDFAEPLSRLLDIAELKRETADACGDGGF
jgi:hypothetical protein